MARLIDADKLIREAYVDGAYGYVDALQIANAPSVDAVEVVRCKDCIFKQNPKRYGELQCKILCVHMNNDDFCSYGERRSDDGGR